MMRRQPIYHTGPMDHDAWWEQMHNYSWVKSRHERRMRRLERREIKQHQRQRHKWAKKGYIDLLEWDAIVQQMRKTLTPNANSEEDLPF